VEPIELVVGVGASDVGALYAGVLETGVDPKLSK